MQEEGQAQSHAEMQSDTEKCHEKKRKTIATVPTRKGPKRRLDAMSEEAYATMKQLSSNMRKRDDFDVYGEYVAGMLRNLKSKSILAVAKYEINNALYRAEMSDISANTPESPTTPASDAPASTPFSQSRTDTDSESYNRPGSSTMPSATEDMSENDFTQMILNL